MEGTITFRGYQTWYTTVGELAAGTRTPVVAIHGGPGDAHDYLKPLAGLAARGFPLVFYDQLGCGRSDRPSDTDLWTFEFFLDELSVLIDSLGLRRAHLLGHSWGGMVAMAYAADHPGLVASLVLAGAPASVPRIAADTRRMVNALPADVRSAIEKHEAAGTTSDPEYQAAVREFSRRHICRLDVWPPQLEHDDSRFGAEVYATICGPSEFCITGRAKDWDFFDRLTEIHAPTLITSGRFDEFTPEHAQLMRQQIPDCRWTCFEHSAHMPHWEEPDLFLDVVGDFLVECDTPRVSGTAAS